jgi:Lipase maturation factor
MDLEISTQQKIVSKVFAFVYLSAFCSNYVQIAGLWSSDGILPAEMIVSSSPLRFFLPYIEKLVIFIPSLGSYSYTDTLLYVISGSGILLSLASLCFNVMENSITFFLLWVLYYFFFSIGGTFLSFQWDILLLESGFLAIFYVKVPIIIKNNQMQIIAREMLRWLLFRYIFGSGVLKLLSKCPTWWSLTALYYHYETQCLPTPLSWYFHQLPQIFQRFSVAFTYFALIFTPPLFFAPVRSLRIFSGLIQIIMQILILITGNYNFFNILSIALYGIFRIFILFDDFFFDFREYFEVTKKRMIFFNLPWVIFRQIMFIAGYFLFIIPPEAISNSFIPFSISDFESSVRHM